MATETVSTMAYRFWGTEKPKDSQPPQTGQDTRIIFVIEDKNPGPVASGAEIEVKPFEPLTGAERFRFGLNARLRQLRYGNVQAVDQRKKYKGHPAGGSNVLREAIAHDARRSRHRGLF